MYDMVMYVRYDGFDGENFNSFEIHDSVEVCVDPDSLYKPEDDGWSQDVYLLENQCLEVLHKRYPEVEAWLERQDQDSIETTVCSFTEEGYRETFGKPLRRGDDGLGSVYRTSVKYEPPFGIERTN